MSKQRDNKLLRDEVIEKASELPLNDQKSVLNIAKAMRFTRDEIEKKSDGEPDDEGEKLP